MPQIAKFKILALVYLISPLFIQSCQTPETEWVTDKTLDYKTDLISIMDSSNIKGADLIVHIDKSARIMTILHQKDTLKQYPVVLGGNAIDDKLCEGDKCTPEGVFGIRDMYPHAKWSKFIWIDYPNESSWIKHRKAKAEGTLPGSARIGGEVGIHGVPAGKDSWIAEGRNWTLGCISLTNADVDELYEAIDLETRIIIQK